MVDPVEDLVDNISFAYHAAALITHGQQILLRRSSQEDFWSPPGGIVKIGEDSEKALQRQLANEIHQEIITERLKWIVENLSENQGRQFHRIGFYYQAQLSPNSPWLTGEGPFFTTASENTSLQIEYCWFPCDPAARAGIRVAPEFLCGSPDAISNYGNPSGKLGIRIWEVSGTIRKKA